MSLSNRDARSRSAVGGLVALSAAVLLVAGCQPGLATTAVTSATPVATASPLASGTGAAMPSEDPVEGVVINVESTGLDSVTAFTLRTADGQTYRFALGRLQGAAQFPPGHLAEHAANAEPIKVTFLALDTTLIATRLEDANPAPPSATPEASASPSATPAPS